MNTIDSTLTNSSTLTLSAAPAASVKPSVRTLAGKWDMLAVIGLMASSAVYGVYALTLMTGF